MIEDESACPHDAWAPGIVALSQQRDDKEKWRWRCFSIGGMLGLVWGAIYLALPVVTGAFLTKPIELIPLIWIDLTPQTSKFLPAVPVNIVMDLSVFLSGMMVPFWGVVGGVLGIVFTMIANPILHDQGILANWKPGMGFIDTTFINEIDFYMSFGIGLTLAVTVVNLGVFLKYLFVNRRTDHEPTELSHTPTVGERFAGGWKILVTNNADRGDFSIFLALGIYLCSTFSWIVLGTMLIPGYPWPIFVFYALVYTPVISYATAKLEGVCGQAVDIPYLRELTIILSGHKGVDIWFAPMPIQNLGAETVGFRTLELCGTKIKSQIKTLLITTPIVVVSSLMASQLLWQMAPVPSDAYPFTQKMWALQVKRWALQVSATMEGGSLFLEALHPKYILWGAGSGSVLFMVLSAVGMPVMLIYGAVWGLSQSSPGATLWMFAGALVGRFYFRRKFKEMWLRYLAVILAGFGCGIGLVAMVSMAFTVITKMLKPTLF